VEEQARRCSLLRGLDRRRAGQGGGGFGAAPKFPIPTVFTLLLRSWKRNGDAQALRMTEESLAAMRNGGVYDQVLLALAYTETWQATGGDFYRRTAREVLSYVLCDMTSPDGAFY
jgi:uncharacterized protein YyaL (SSP411 family)